MPNPFDRLKQTVFDTTTRAMGYDATWLPSDAIEGAEPYAARVHLKEAEEKQEMGGVEFMPLNPFMEYRSPFFPGLYEKCRRENGGERVIIEGREYEVRQVVRMFDGDTYQAILQRIDP